MRGLDSPSFILYEFQWSLKVTKIIHSVKIQFSLIYVMVYLILHLCYMWLAQIVNSSRQGACSLIWLQKDITCFIINSDSGRCS